MLHGLRGNSSERTSVAAKAEASDAPPSPGSSETVQCFRHIINHQLPGVTTPPIWHGCVWEPRFMTSYVPLGRISGLWSHEHLCNFSAFYSNQQSICRFWFSACDALTELHWRKILLNHKSEIYVEEHFWINVFSEITAPFCQAPVQL